MTIEELERENEQLKEQLTALERLQTENGAELDRMRGSSAVAVLLAADRTQRERELIEEIHRLREANRRLQAEGPALERDKLVGQLRVRVAAEEILTKKLNSQLAATKEALAQARKVADVAVADRIVKRALFRLDSLVPRQADRTRDFFAAKATLYAAEMATGSALHDAIAEYRALKEAA